MAFDPSALTDHSWSDIKLAAKHAMVSAAMGGSTLSINGRSLGRISISEAKKLYEMAEDMIAAEDTSSLGGIALVQYGDPVDGASRSECD
jgi:hypothetical protein